MSSKKSHPHAQVEHQSAAANRLVSDNLQNQPQTATQPFILKAKPTSFFTNYQIGKRLQVQLHHFRQRPALIQLSLGVLFVSLIASMVIAGLNLTNPRQPLEVQAAPLTTTWTWQSPATKLKVDSLGTLTPSLEFSYQPGDLTYTGQIHTYTTLEPFTYQAGRLSAKSTHASQATIGDNCRLQGNDSVSADLQTVSGRLALELSSAEIAQLQQPGWITIEEQQVSKPEFEQLYLDCELRIASLQQAWLNQARPSSIVVTVNQLVTGQVGVNFDDLTLTGNDLNLFQPGMAICPCDNESLNSGPATEAGQKLREQLQFFKPEDKLKLGGNFYLVDTKPDQTFDFSTGNNLANKYKIVLTRLDTINDLPLQSPLQPQPAQPKPAAPAPTPAPKPTPPAKTPTKPKAKPAPKTQPTTAKPAPTQPTPSGCTNSEFNAQVLCLFNQYRQSKGLGKFSGNTGMSNVAAKHSQWMNQNGKLSHTGEDDSTPVDRCKQGGTSCRAENIAFGSNMNANLAFELWKNDPPHNAILLGPYSQIGIGRAGGYVTTVYL